MGRDRMADVKSTNRTDRAVANRRLIVVLASYVLLMHQTVAAQGVILTLPAEPETDWTKPAFWESMDGRPVEESWQFENSEIGLLKPRGGRGSLLSGPLPPHFELSWRWKIEAKTNSGLKYRVRQFSGAGWVWNIKSSTIHRVPRDKQAKAAPRPSMTWSHRSPTNHSIHPASGMILEWSRLVTASSTI